METQTENTKASKKSNAVADKPWKKKNIEIRKFEEGDTLIGKFLKRRENPDFMDKTTGEIKTLVYLIFEDLETQQKFQVIENAGLKNCLNANDVNENDSIKLVHLGKQPIKGTAKTVNTYDLFTLN